MNCVISGCGPMNAAGVCPVHPLMRQPPQADLINQPPHYKSEGGIEAIDVIESFRLGNAVKYILRHSKKGTPLEDLKKARWYLDRKIAAVERDLAKAGGK